MPSDAGACALVRGTREACSETPAAQSYSCPRRMVQLAQRLERRAWWVARQGRCTVGDYSDLTVGLLGGETPRGSPTRETFRRLLPDAAGIVR